MTMNGPRELYEQHREEIGRVLYGGEDPGPIDKLRRVGDRHLHGASVMRIQTTLDKTLYFKPRDCESTELLGELTQLLFGERMVPAQVCDAGWAFVQEVSEAPPNTEQGKRRFFVKMGELTALFYALGSTDMHSENVCCADGTPLVIDTETILCTQVEGLRGAGEFSPDYGDVFAEYKTSVAECMVLPRFYGFHQTTPLIRGKSLRPEGFEDAYLQGFCDGYAAVIDNKQEVSKILERHRNATVRILLRSTQTYAVKVFAYSLAKDPKRQEQILQRLDKGLSEEDLTHWQAVLAWERACIREGDIPYFCVRAVGTELYGDPSEAPLMEQFALQSPIEYAKWRIGRMGPDDLAVQTAYIRASLRHLDEHIATQPAAGNDLETKTQDALTANEAVQEVEDALTRLYDERIPLSDGRCLWHFPMIGGRVGSMFGLAEGFAGIGVFARACATSAAVAGKYGRIAAELSAACFEDMAAFAEHLLTSYRSAPEGRILRKRFGGALDMADGVRGLLWALAYCGGEDPHRAQAILDGFRAWGLESAYSNGNLLPAEITDEDAGNCPDGKVARRAIELMSRPEDDIQRRGVLVEAGVLLKQVRDARAQSGSYRVFLPDRKQYFVPAFLRGSTGIAYAFLVYAERAMQYGVGL